MTTKAETLDHWRGLTPNQDPYPHMESIPYKAKGSRYGACGIRIDGSPEFIDAVLSNLKSLIQGENDNTRLELSRNQVDGRGLNKSFDLQADHAEACYIRLHERGHEARIYNAIIRNVHERVQARMMEG